MVGGHAETLEMQGHVKYVIEVCLISWAGIHHRLRSLVLQVCAQHQVVRFSAFPQREIPFPQYAIIWACILMSNKNPCSLAVRDELLVQFSILLTIP